MNHLRSNKNEVFKQFLKHKYYIINHTYLKCTTWYVLVSLSSMKPSNHHHNQNNGHIYYLKVSSWFFVTSSACPSSLPSLGNHLPDHCQYRFIAFSTVVSVKLYSIYCFVWFLLMSIILSYFIHDGACVRSPVLSMAK